VSRSFFVFFMIVVWSDWILVVASRECYNRGIILNDPT
jgi:hypothetical protein